MTENKIGALVCLLFLSFTLLACPAKGQDARKVPISFLPPPLETATFSLGIYDSKTGKLVRRLKEAATQDAFTVGLNGLITSWDGNDDAGKPVPPGKYAARGYAVGALKVEGEQILGNDWTASDENLRIKRIDAINVLPADNVLVILATMADESVRVVCFDASGDKVRWTSEPVAILGKDLDASAQSVYSLATNDEYLMATALDHGNIYHAANGQIFQGAFGQTGMEPSGPASLGKDSTTWKVEGGILSQYSVQGEKLRQLTTNPGGPRPAAVAASKISDRLYLLEESPGWQRVRGLSWLEAKQDGDKAVSTWQTFFERDIREQNPATSLNPELPVEINLVENPLDPGKPQKVGLSAGFDDQGSYLMTIDGLRLRRISQRTHLRAARLERAKTAKSLSFLQSDGAAWDEFSITGTRNIMAFDAGEFEMTADGERLHTEKAAEPADEP